MTSTPPSADLQAGESQIRPIDSTSIHRIHSGQVILSLENAVKELLENSLDAGANIIEVRIKDNGLESIEVIDNGSGISSPDWASLALKHHTSKLRAPTAGAQPDLTQITTFGFRGEALSALCALCEKVEVTTCTAEMKGLARILAFDREGKLVDDEPGGPKMVARQRGTTVSLQKLFHPLPVRRKEFERNAKKEFAKALGMLTSYGLVPCAGGWGGDEDDEEATVKRGVRLIVDGVNKAGKRTNHLRTTGAPLLSSSITSLFGPKSLQTLVGIDLPLSVDIDKIMAKREGLDSETKLNVRVVGMVSKAESGMGRTGGGGQYWYLNGRPFNPGKIARAVNETYRSYNSAQTPFVVLDFKVPNDSIDINVSPDKKTIYLHSEANLIESLAHVLDEFYAPSRGTYAVQNTSAPTLRGMSSRSQVSEPHVGASNVSTKEGAQTGLHASRSSFNEDVVPPTPDKGSGTWSPSPEPRRRARSPASAAPATPAHRLAPRPHGASPSHTNALVKNGLLPATPPTSQGLPASHFTPTDRQVLEYEEEDELDDSQPEGMASLRENSGVAQVGETLSSDLDDEPVAPRRNKPLVQPTLMALGQGWKMGREGEVKESASSTSSDRRTKQQTKLMFRDRLAGFASQSTQVDLSTAESDEEVEGSEEEIAKIKRPIAVEQADTIDSDAIDLDIERILPDDDETLQRDNIISTTDLPDISHRTDRHNGEIQGDMQDSVTYIAEAATAAPEDAARRMGFRSEIATRASKREVITACDLEKIRKRYKRNRTAHGGSDNSSIRDSHPSSPNLLPAAGVNNQDSTEVDRTLSRVIQKEDFAGMEVIGQYNKAFIIARRQVTDAKTQADSDDLFIIDQHASDEKYNFETLQAVTKIQSQRLIQPKKLSLTAADEITVMENLDIFASNGFGLTVDEDAPYGQGEKIRLIAMPVSKETTFDEKDLKELIFLLQEQYIGTMVRCKKARAMFAMRACRKSVMFGHALSQKQMVSVTRHMGEIEHPWNCPHGRPTMRHLLNLSNLRKEEEEEHDFYPSRVIDWAKIAEKQ